MAVVDEEYGRRQDHNTTVSTHYHYKYKQYGRRILVTPIVMVTTIIMILRACITGGARSQS